MSVQPPSYSTTKGKWNDKTQGMVHVRFVFLLCSNESAHLENPRPAELEKYCDRRCLQLSDCLGHANAELASGREWVRRDAHHSAL